MSKSGPPNNYQTICTMWGANGAMKHEYVVGRLQIDVIIICVYWHSAAVTRRATSTQRNV